VSNLVRGLSYNIGIFVSAGHTTNGSHGWLNFSDVHVNETDQPGLEFENKAATRMPLTFDRCSWVNVATGAAIRWYKETHAGQYNWPLLLHQSDKGAVGGIRFNQCMVHDTKPRPWLKCDSCGDDRAGPATLVSGSVLVENRHGCTESLGPNASDISLAVSCNDTATARASLL